ncbi:MAG: hypothetical protein ACXABY_01705 [Candidatus Thorarchaeota archaeon]|jgi:hypothetical protein
MNLNEEIWGEINATPALPEEVKSNLHVRIMRLIELAQATPVGKKLGVTVMTQEASLAADKVAADRKNKPLAGDPKPKSV